MLAAFAQAELITSTQEVLWRARGSHTLKPVLFASAYASTNNSRGGLPLLYTQVPFIHETHVALGRRPSRGHAQEDSPTARSESIGEGVSRCRAVASPLSKAKESAMINNGTHAKLGRSIAPISCQDLRAE